MQQHRSMVANIMPADSPQLWGQDLKGQNSTFSEHGNVAYHKKWNYKCSNMVVHILPADPFPLPDPGGVKMSKFNFFRALSPNISN